MADHPYMLTLCASMPSSPNKEVTLHCSTTLSKDWRASMGRVSSSGVNSSTAGTVSIRRQRICSHECPSDLEVARKELRSL
eukprot:scaffold70496_cov14-Tisochrysis_lutea.AAC.1